MRVILITGSAGLIGSEAARFFAAEGYCVVGIDNDMRRQFFGTDASTDWNRTSLEFELGDAYQHKTADIRDQDAMDAIFRDYSGAIACVIHTAAQPSHDWAARDPRTDFAVNAGGTLNLLEAARRHAAEASFIFTSTNKVYGDTPNALPLVELEQRWEVPQDHPYHGGIREDMSVDQNLHSLFGVSKLAADTLVQEYGRYFGLKTACFRCGCLTGPGHCGTQLHGFLSYLMKCAVLGQPYTVFGYKAKQVRDNIHSSDLVRAFDEFMRAPRIAEVYNMGGGRTSNCSMLEAIELCEQIADTKLNWTYSNASRRGDHIWWISDNGKFMSHYPSWRINYDLRSILREIYDHNVERWAETADSTLAV